MPFVTFQRDVLKVKRTLPQRALFAVGIDHVDPCDLPTAEERDIARLLFGDVDRIPASARGTFALLKGARVGGTLACSEVLLWSALTCDLSGLARGEQAFAVAVAPQLKLAQQSARYALGAAKGVRDIARLIESESADGFVIRRPDGRAVSIETLAAGRGGGALRGRSLVACSLDEATFFYDAESGVVNDLELYRAVAPRIVNGGRLMVLSTAWMDSGLLMGLVSANHGAPETCIAAIAPTLTLRPGDVKLAQLVADERKRDPDNAAREFDCVPFDGAMSSSFIDATSIDAMVDHSLPTTGAQL
jgi:hypothetical protein